LPQQGGVLKSLRGKLPVQVPVRRQELASFSDPGQAAGKSISIPDEGLRLTLQESRTIGGLLNVKFQLAAPPNWRHIPGRELFELTDRRGQKRQALRVQFLANPPANRPATGVALDLLAGTPQAGFPGSVPWPGLARWGESLKQHWSVQVQFVLPAGVEPEARLSFATVDWAATELPFEFRDLPVP
jgi:hypothetical protein